MRKIGWIVLVGAILLSACGKQLPDEVIPPAKMEQILYDYHLALGISSQLNSAEEYKKQSYKNYLFKKHHITEAQFDSSMVWYTRNSYELSEIYQNLDKRFNREKTKLNAMLQERNITVSTLTGDTVDLWNHYPVYWLTNAPLSNKFSFNMKADTNFWVKDAFFWKADVTFLANGKATMGLNIRFKNDSVVGKTTTITQSGSNSIYLLPDSTYEIKEINGFIQIYKDSIHQEPSIIVSNISLTKYHTNDENIVQTTEKMEEKEKSVEKKDKTPKIKAPITSEPQKIERVSSRPKRKAAKD